jgi:hypothetical protein
VARDDGGAQLLEILGRAARFLTLLVHVFRTLIRWFSCAWSDGNGGATNIPTPEYPFQTAAGRTGLPEI